MQVDERIVMEVSAETDDDVAWFVARQPGIVRYLESRLATGSDALGLALFGASFVHAAFHKALGSWPPRVLSSRLESAESSVLHEAETRPGDGFVARQPALAEFVAGVVASPPFPLGEDDATRVGLTLATVVYALDDMSAPETLT
jgi:hypothetical protein